MSHRKINLSRKALLLGVCGSGALLLSACSTVGDVWDYATTSSDSSLRTPTGYYDHTHSQELQDPLVVPSGLSNPYTDHAFDVPNQSVTEQSRLLVGEAMDVRPPVVSQVGESGIEIMSQGSEALVWFLPYNKFNVHTVNDAWTALGLALNFMKVPVAESNPASYAVATAPAWYAPDGTLYSNINEDFESPRYNQVFRINVGTSTQGVVGYSVSLVSSSPDEDNERAVAVLNPRQQSSFTVGFANSIIKALVQQQAQAEVVPDVVNVFLGRDNNDQDALFVNAPYQATWNVMRGLLSQYGFTVEEYSVSSSSLNVVYEERDPEEYRNMGLQPFNLTSGDYIVRLGVSGNQTVITFYDEDDRPLTGSTVATLYQGMSQAIVREFEVYKREGASYLAKFSEED